MSEGMKKIEEAIDQIKMADPETKSYVQAAAMLLAAIVDMHEGYALNTIIETSTHRYTMTMIREDL